MNKKEVMSMMNYSVGNNFSISVDNDFGTNDGTSTGNNSSNTCWYYWQDYYYPLVIRDSHPVYIQERAKDKGKQAFEIIKILKDKKLVKIEKVGDFIEIMNELIKIL